MGDRGIVLCGLGSAGSWRVYLAVWVVKCGFCAEKRPKVGGFLRDGIASGRGVHRF